MAHFHRNGKKRQDLFSCIQHNFLFLLKLLWKRLHLISFLELLSYFSFPFFSVGERCTQKQRNKADIQFLTEHLNKLTLSVQYVCLQLLYYITLPFSQHLRYGVKIIEEIMWMWCIILVEERTEIMNILWGNQEYEFFWFLRIFLNFEGWRKVKMLFWFEDLTIDLEFLKDQEVLFWYTKG